MLNLNWHLGFVLSIIFEALNIFWYSEGETFVLKNPITFVYLSLFGLEWSVPRLLLLARVSQVSVCHPFIIAKMWLIASLSKQLAHILLFWQQVKCNLYIMLLICFRLVETPAQWSAGHARAGTCCPRVSRSWVSGGWVWPASTPGTRASTSAPPPTRLAVSLPAPCSGSRLENIVF